MKRSTIVTLSKCEFGKTQVEFLGHVVGGGNISMAPDKVRVVQDWPTPKSPHELRQFLGMCNYYRKFIKNYSEIAKPMYELLKSNIPYIWSDKCQLSFDRLKLSITSEPVLKLPDDSKPWIIYSDASGYAVGGVLCQDHGRGPQPVLYASHKLSGCELNWPTHDKELFGIVFMIKVCKPYLQGRSVTIYTDHKSLQYVKTQPSLSAKQTRWVQFLDTFDWDVQYKEGKLNVVADAISRRPDLQTIDTVQQHNTNIDKTNNNNNDNDNYYDDDDILDNTMYVYAISSCDIGNDFINRLKQSYNDDEACKQLIADNGNKDYTVKNGLIYRGNRLYIPQLDGLQQPLISEYHDTTAVCHRGIEKTYHMISQNYYWLNMHKTVEDYVKSCHCLQHKNTNNQQHAMLQQRAIPQRKFSEITMDFITGLPKTNKSNNGILVIVDRLTKWCVFIPFSTERSTDVPAAEITAELVYNNWVVHYGVPTHITSDRDPQFTSKYWKSLWASQGTELGFSTAYHPQTDGQTERTNRTIQEMLRIYCSDKPRDWDYYLSRAQHAINHTPTSTTNISPYEFAFEQKPSLAVDRIVESNVPLAENNIINNRQSIQKAIDELNKARNRQKQYYDKHVKEITFDIGSYGYVHTTNLRSPTDVSRKLTPKWAGPFRIIEKVGNVAYKLKLPQSLLDKNVHDVFNVNKLHKYNPRQIIYKDGNELLPPGPELIEGEYEWEVESIVGKRKYRNTNMYLVHWKGWNRYHDSWELESELVNAKDAIDLYNRNQALQAIDQLTHSVYNAIPQKQNNNINNRRNNNRIRQYNSNSIICASIDLVVFNICQ